VVDAEPDAVLYLGFRDGVEPGDVRRCLGTADIVELLQPIPALPGAFHHLPAGVVHALGAGVMVAEPQTPSDTTFRFYDWAEEYGRERRDLHFAEGLKAVRMQAGPESLPALVGDGRRLLVETAHYSVIQHRSSAGTVELDDSPELRIVMVVDGEVIVSDAGDGPRRAARGRTVLIPAVAAPAVRLDVAAPATVLEIALVPPAR
jgi:mannose-6-phosphate isomerase